MKRDTIKPITLVKMIGEMKKINFNHPLQRREGQWSIEQKSKLIDSILRDFIIDPARIVRTMVDDNGNVYRDEKGKDIEFNICIDGKQRMTTIREFMEDKFKISKHVEGYPAFYIDGEPYNMDNYIGAKYSELPDEVRAKIEKTDFNIVNLYDVSEWDIREMFKRQNGGKGLTKAQMNSAIISPDLYANVESILNAPGCTLIHKRQNKNGDIVEKEKMVGNFWDRFLGTGAFKNGEDRNLVLATMMFVSKYNNFEFGLLNDDIEDFIDWFSAQEEAFRTDVIETVIAAADAINSKVSYEEKKIPNLKKTSIPMVVAGMAKVITSKGSKSAYMEQIKAFFDDYKENKEYLALVGSGSASKENAQARWEVFEAFAKKKKTTVGNEPQGGDTQEQENNVSE